MSIQKPLPLSPYEIFHFELMRHILNGKIPFLLTVIYCFGVTVPGWVILVLVLYLADIQMRVLNQVIVDL